MQFDGFGAETNEPNTKFKRGGDLPRSLGISNGPMEPFLS